MHSSRPINRPAIIAIAAIAAIFVASAASSASLGAQLPRKAGSTAATPTGSGRYGEPERWADSVLATMTLKDRAAQMVWPNIYADYVPADAPSWRRITSYVTDE